MCVVLCTRGARSHAPALPPVVALEASLLSTAAWYYRCYRCFIHGITGIVAWYYRYCISCGPNQPLAPPPRAPPSHRCFRVTLLLAAVVLIFVVCAFAPLSREMGLYIVPMLEWAAGAVLVLHLLSLYHIVSLRAL